MALNCEKNMDPHYSPIVTIGDHTDFYQNLSVKFFFFDLENGSQLILLQSQLTGMFGEDSTKSFVFTRRGCLASYKPNKYFRMTLINVIWSQGDSWDKLHGFFSFLHIIADSIKFLVWYCMQLYFYTLLCPTFYYLVFISRAIDALL